MVQGGGWGNGWGGVAKQGRRPTWHQLPGETLDWKVVQSATTCPDSFVAPLISARYLPAWKLGNEGMYTSACTVAPLFSVYVLGRSDGSRKPSCVVR